MSISEIIKNVPKSAIIYAGACIFTTVTTVLLLSTYGVFADKKEE